MADYQRNFLDALTGGYQFGQQIKQQREENRLKGLASLAQGAPVEQRQSLLSQIAGIDPGFAQAQKKAWSADDEADREELVRMARFIKQAPPEQQPAAYASILPKLRERGMQAPEWGPDSQDMILKTVDALAGAYGDPRSGTGVQSTYVDGQGNRVAIMRDGSTAVLGQNAPNNQIIDTGNGFFGVNKGSLSASPVVVGGQQQAPQPSLQAGLYQTPAGMVRIGEGLTPEQQQAAVADIQAGGTANNVQLPARNVAPQQFGGGQQLRSATKPQAPSELDRRIEAARAMGASEDEIRRMIIGRDGAAAGAKPLPMPAVKELLAVEDAMAAAQNVSTMIKKHSQRMADGSLVVGPVDSIAAQFRTRLGMSNANDVNLNEYRADLTKIVNESLRLNSGVQTEGDAQRAANELMDANDPATAARALRRLQEYNTRAIELQKRKMELVRRNYGQDASGQPAQQRVPAQSGGVDDLLSKYGAN